MASSKCHPYYSHWRFLLSPVSYPHQHSNHSNCWPTHYLSLLLMYHNVYGGFNNPMIFVLPPRAENILTTTTGGICCCYSIHQIVPHISPSPPFMCMAIGLLTFCCHYFSFGFGGGSIILGAAELNLAVCLKPIKVIVVSGTRNKHMAHWPC